jgi:osmotically inducible protein OsmC
MPTRKATAKWEGGLKGGKGSFSTDTIAGTFSFLSRFADGPGSTPEGLLGAAHASCFSMALSAALEREGATGTTVETTSAVTAEKLDTGFAITGIKLVTTVTSGGFDRAKILELAEATRTGCIVAKALSAVPITLETIVN